MPSSKPGLRLGPPAITAAGKLKIDLELDLAHVDASAAALKRKPAAPAPPPKASHGGANFEEWKNSSAHDKWLQEQMALSAAMNSVYASYGSKS